MIMFKVLVGVAVFWLWFFFGSRYQCPNCGISLEDEWSNTVRDWCTCGWRRSNGRAQ